MSSICCRENGYQDPIQAALIGSKCCLEVDNQGIRATELAEQA
jgi:hypothetical protein